LKTTLTGLLGIGLLVIFSSSAAARHDEAVQSDQQANAVKEAAKVDAGDTAWMLTSTGLVLLMVPGLALFYGGMVRRKNILGTMMHSAVALAIIGIQWLAFGYAIAFGISYGGWLGWTSDYLFLNDVLPNSVFPGTHIPVLVHCMYQGMFAIITPALISGAVAERIRFGPYCLFILLWSTLVYDPLAHWVWAVDAAGRPAGWLGKLGALDFAGGTVVHVAAGLSGLAAIVALRKRLGYPEHAIHPNSMVLTLLGAGLLWFGWFGFNGGSALGANGLAGAALAASQVAAAAAALSWMTVEWLHKGKPTALGFASGVVAGLVAITPASGFVTPQSALVIGLVAGLVCYASVYSKVFFKYDDSLDAFGVHGVGGFLGALLTGAFASQVFWQAGAGSTESLGALDKGWSAQLLAQFTAAVVAVVYSFVLTYVMVRVIDRSWGFCLDQRSESEGLDRSEHGEVGFDLGPALDIAPEQPAHEPRPADLPPDGMRRRFIIAVEGADPRELTRVWSDLCQAGAAPPSPEFRAVYPYLTTFQDNRFSFRGGAPEEIRRSLEQLLRDRLKPDGTQVRARLELPKAGGDYR
jgi:ammonium transporter